MERDEFKILVKSMKAVYAQPTFLPDQDAFNVWYALLKDLPYELASMAVQKHMLTEISAHDSRYTGQSKRGGRAAGRRYK